MEGRKPEGMTIRRSMLDAEVARVRNASAATPQHLFDGRDRATQHNREIRIKGTIKLSINSPEEILTCIATDAIDATDGSQGGKLSYVLKAMSP